MVMKKWLSKIKGRLELLSGLYFFKTKWKNEVTALKWILYYNHSTFLTPSIIKVTNFISPFFQLGNGPQSLVYWMNQTTRMTLFIKKLKNQVNECNILKNKSQWIFVKKGVLLFLIEVKYSKEETRNTTEHFKKCIAEKDYKERQQLWRLAKPIEELLWGTVGCYYHSLKLKRLARILG